MKTIDFYLLWAVVFMDIVPVVLFTSTFKAGPRAFCLEALRFYELNCLVYLRSMVSVVDSMTNSSVQLLQPVPSSTVLVASLGASLWTSSPPRQVYFICTFI